nr:transposase [Vibrio jasicida]
MTDNTVVSLNTPQDPLTELIRQGARDLIAQAVEAELQQLLAQHQNVMVDGKQAIVHNGFLPERTLQTGVGDVEVQIPKVRDPAFFKIVVTSCLLIKQSLFLDLDERHQLVRSF